MANFYTPTKKRPQLQKLQVEIRALDAFGQGIASYQGKTIFVRNGLPGENVDIRLTEDKKQYAKAEIIRRYSDSPERVKPCCHHFGVCGGCQLQHASSSVAQQSKLDALLRLIERESGASLSHVEPEIIAAEPYHYRRRARLALRVEKNRIVMGFRRETSQDIIDITMCPVLTSELEALIEPLRECLNRLSAKRELGHIELISVDSGIIIALRHIKPLSDADKQILQTFASNRDISLYLQGEVLVQLTGHSDPYYLIDELKLTFSPLDFIQVNGLINQKMVKQALSWLALSDSDYVLDLFCGMGNFSLPIATQAKQVVGIEGVDALVKKAQANTTLNNQRNEKKWLNAVFYQHDLDSIVNQQHWLKETPFNKVLLDPARAGALNMVTNIAKMACSHIVYISCNPATLARDSKILVEAGYKIDKLAILDMFPQTKHLESMIRFTK